MESPVTTFLYVLMRDHLPTGTVKFLIEQAQRAGKPTYSAPELEQLAERYAAELLNAGPRDTSEPDDEEELPPVPPGIPGSWAGDLRDDERGGASPPSPPAVERAAARSSKLADRVVAAMVPGEWMAQRDILTRLPEGQSPNSLRFTVQRLVKDERIEAKGDRASRRYRLPEQNAEHTSEPDDGEPADPANEVSGAGTAAKPPSSPDGAGDPPAQTRSAVGESPASSSKPEPVRDLADSLREAAGEEVESTPEVQRVERVAAHLDSADGEVWPHELEVALGLNKGERKRAINTLFEEGRVTIIGRGGPHVRYRSAKKRRPAPRRSTGAGEAAEPIGSSAIHTRDPEKERRAEAKATQAEADDALKRLGEVRQWARGGNQFTPRQLRDTFGFSTAGTTRVIAALLGEGFLTRNGEVYCAKVSNGNGRIERNGKRPLGNADGGSSLESRVLGLLGAGSYSLAQIAERLQVSEEVAKAVVGKLFREGDVRPRSQGGTLLYAAV